MFEALSPRPLPRLAGKGEIKGSADHGSQGSRPGLSYSAPDGAEDRAYHEPGFTVELVLLALVPDT